MGSFYVLIPIVFKHSWMSGFIGAYTKEALQWPYWGVYRVSLAMALLRRVQRKPHNGLSRNIQRKPRELLPYVGRRLSIEKLNYGFSRIRKSTDCYCFNAVGKEIENGRD